ncbi:MAG TPA: AraC family transcriptional regulator ligand-binding domain-containing protein [Agitococcus sp.]|nr:AraC family transcriptional regulator ligand-binding domain-containing protein [Agitococcus sp.]HNJ85099.1 AraC family transcriptional regulator ligand-binding domain-containing protein [Agitococcus sp.]HNP01591.1 AraC family transcriptional regulator ligand-binding domain-containing protein [Agitococcus sp.]
MSQKLMLDPSYMADDIANIPSNYSRIIGRELELQMRDLPKLLKFTQLSPEQFLQDDILLTTRQQVQILHNALQLSPHPDFGLRLGRHLTPATHGAMGFLVNSSPNLLMALHAFQSFVPTRMSFVRLNFKTQQEWVECEIRFETLLSEEIYRSLLECCLMVFVACAEFIIGRPLTEAQIFFSFAKPNYSHVYRDYFMANYQFSAPYSNIKIPLETCHIPNASANYDNYVLAMKQCETMLSQLKSHKCSTTYQLQKMMLSQPLGTLSEEDAAAALFISKRTLARHLAKEGSSYMEIREKLLSEQASHYLRNSTMSVEAIASLLNYHDSANFRRAFKRWFAVSPKEYRQQFIV